MDLTRSEIGPSMRWFFLTRLRAHVWYVILIQGPDCPLTVHKQDR